MAKRVLAVVALSCAAWPCWAFQNVQTFSLKEGRQNAAKAPQLAPQLMERRSVRCRSPVVSLHMSGMDDVDMSAFFAEVEIPSELADICCQHVARSTILTIVSIGEPPGRKQAGPRAAWRASHCKINTSHTQTCGPS